MELIPCKYEHFGAEYRLTLAQAMREIGAELNEWSVREALRREVRDFVESCYADLDTIDNWLASF